MIKFKFLSSLPNVCDFLQIELGPFTSPYVIYFLITIMNHEHTFPTMMNYQEKPCYKYVLKSEGQFKKRNVAWLLTVHSKC